MNRNPAARFFGIVVFVVGVGIIVAVVWLGYDIFRAPQLGMQIPAAAASPAAGVKGASPPPALGAQQGVEFGMFALRIGLLALGALAGSLIASKGVRLYAAAQHP